MHPTCSSCVSHPCLSPRFMEFKREGNSLSILYRLSLPTNWTGTQMDEATDAYFGLIDSILKVMRFMQYLCPTATFLCPCNQPCYAPVSFFCTKCLLTLAAIPTHLYSHTRLNFRSRPGVNCSFQLRLCVPVERRQPAALLRVRRMRAWRWVCSLNSLLDCFVCVCA